MKDDIKILIVEDEAITAMLIRSKIKAAGFVVSEVAATGEKAVEIVKSNKPNIILMDIQLAGTINGIEAARQIKNFCDIPVIFMTGYSDDDVINRAKELSPLAYFIKPLNMPEVIATIEKFFSGKSSV